MTIKARSIALKGLQSTERLDVSLSFRNADSARPPYRGSARTDTLGIRDRPAWMQQQPIEPEFIESGTYGDHDYLALRHSLISWRHCKHGMAGGVLRVARPRATAPALTTVGLLQIPRPCAPPRADRTQYERLRGTRDTRFHTIWPIDDHEGVHTLVILQIGHPPALFNEGVAVAHQTDPARGILTPRWNGTDLHALARQYDVAGRIPPLTSLFRSSAFFSFDSNVTYSCAGSFVRYLIDKYGLSALKAYFASATFDDAPSITESRFLAAYGRTLTALWEEWRAWIGSVS